MTRRYTGTLPRISLVTPTYQHGHHLEETIRSVVTQGYPNLEYFVVDGGSTDATPSILRKYDASMARWVSEPDDGQADAINKGLSWATGSIFGWLNSSDTLAAGALFAIGYTYATRPDIDLLYGHTFLVGENGEVLTRLLAVPTTPRELIHYNRNIWAQPGTTWRRELHERVDGLDASLHFGMDCDFWIKAALNGRIHHLPRHLANLRVHQDSKSLLMRDTAENDHRLLDERYGDRRKSGFGYRLFKVRRAARILRRPSNLAYRAGWAEGKRVRTREPIMSVSRNR